MNNLKAVQKIYSLLGIYICKFSFSLTNLTETDIIFDHKYMMKRR